MTKGAGGEKSVCVEGNCGSQGPLAFLPSHFKKGNDVIGPTKEKKYGSVHCVGANHLFRVEVQTLVFSYLNPRSVAVSKTASPPLIQGCIIYLSMITLWETNQ